MRKTLFLLLITCCLFNCRPADRPTVGAGGSTDRKDVAAEMEESLLHETLDKWYPMCVDQEHGGFITTYTYDWKPSGNQDKMIVTQARHTWVNARASQLYPQRAYFMDGALHGYRFLRDRMWDRDYGGFYSLVRRDGSVADSMKTAYGNAFAIYALSGVYAATGDTAALNLAKRTFEWLEKHSHDPAHGGYYQHMGRNGTVIRRTPAVHPKAETGFKDQNSSIHLLEAFSELYSVWPDPLLRKRLEEMLHLVRDVITTREGYLVLFFKPDWTPVSFRDSSRAFIEEYHALDHVSFGHDIETAYLLLEASEVLGRKHDAKTLEVAKRMADHALRNGFDSVAGGLYDEGYYFQNENGISIIRDSKNWWAQAEAMHTLLIMATLFPDDAMDYDGKFLKQWRYVDEYLIDHEYGDWYAGGVDKEPHHKKALKGHQWKGTYHHFRALAGCIRMLRSDEPASLRLKP